MSGRERCRCGCDERTRRLVYLLREQDRGTAEALRWAEDTIRRLRVPVPLKRGHVPVGYVDEGELKLGQ